MSTTAQQPATTPILVQLSAPEFTAFLFPHLSTAVRGLEICFHFGPSTLDHRTLAQSGPLPLAFLRSCGLPDTLIDHLPSLLNEPFQFYSCFISGRVPAGCG